MNVKIIGNSAVISSDLTKANIRLLEGHDPSALQLINDKTENVIFEVGFGKLSCVTPYGVVFNQEDKANKKVFATAFIPEDSTDAKTFVANTYGKTLVNLALVEKTAIKRAEAIAKNISDIAETITEISVTE